MLNQAELNFYGFNPKNIMRRENRGKIAVSLCYDPNNKQFVVTRKTPKTTWQDRYSDLNQAKRRFDEYLYNTNDALETMIRNK